MRGSLGDPCGRQWTHDPLKPLLFLFIINLDHLITKVGILAKQKEWGLGELFIGMWKIFFFPFSPWNPNSVLSPHFLFCVERLLSSAKYNMMGWQEAMGSGQLSRHPEPCRLCQTLGVAGQTGETIGPLCLGLESPPSISKLTELLR